MEAGEPLGSQEEEEVPQFEHRVSESQASAEGAQREEDRPPTAPGPPERLPMLDRIGALVTILDRKGRIRWINRFCERSCLSVATRVMPPRIETAEVECKNIG